ncbi:hypothetical protein KIPB_005300, partial [Kipferlia bialata]
FNLYKPYVRSHAEVSNFLQHDAPSDVKKALTAMSAEHGYRIDDLLIEPIQRLPRLRLLLLEFRKKMTEAHPDWEDMNTAIEKLTATVTGINDAKRVEEGKTKVLELQRNLKSAPPDLIQPHRSVISEMMMEVSKTTVSPNDMADLLSSGPDSAFLSPRHDPGEEPEEEGMKPRHVFLLTDLLLVVKDKDSGEHGIKRSLRGGAHKYRLKAQLPLKHAKIVWPGPGDDPLMHQIVCPGVLVSLKARCQADADRWMGLLQDTKAQLDQNSRAALGRRKSGAMQLGSDALLPRTPRTVLDAESPAISMHDSNLGISPGHHPGNKRHTIM